jgi:hypothetical protein
MPLPALAVMGIAAGANALGNALTRKQGSTGPAFPRDVEGLREDTVALLRALLQGGGFGPTKAATSGADLMAMFATGKSPSGLSAPVGPGVQESRALTGMRPYHPTDTRGRGQSGRGQMLMQLLQALQQRRG